MFYSKERIIKNGRNLFKLLLWGALCFSACAMNSERAKPISNPFFAYHGGVNGDPDQAMILRTKKGDRTVEIAIPGDTQRLSDFVLPVSPAFKDTERAPASVGSDEALMDDSYKTRKPSLSDREILQTFSQGSIDDQTKRSSIEKDLNLVSNEDETAGAASYLAAIDHVKQLYRSSRFEAALLETDELIRLYQTDYKLYEMRGTLLDRLGRRELALKAWNQALRLEPKNDRLKRFLERRQGLSKGGSP